MKPERSDGGHRLYTRAQIEQLRFVMEGLARGYSRQRPIACSVSSSSAAAASAQRMSGSERLASLILLAERDPYAAEFAEFFLQTEGYESLSLLMRMTQRASSSNSPQLAVIELLISGGTGAHLCQRLKKPEFPRAGDLDARRARPGARSGADAFLRKPLDPLQFVSTVKDLLEERSYNARRRDERASRERPFPPRRRARRRPPGRRNQHAHRSGTGKTILANNTCSRTRRSSGPPSTSPRCRSRSTKSSATGRASASSTRQRSATQSSTRTSGPALNERGLAGVLEQVTALIKERRQESS